MRKKRSVRRTTRFRIKQVMGIAASGRQAGARVPILWRVGRVVCVEEAQAAM
ncbi:hypothetical protein HanRHA438_Chr04g0184921 [Helianthus annuus]|nr:hypothetical protein HanRHA438_Chr04g0184921 [Helianthus annuus]